MGNFSKPALERLWLVANFYFLYQGFAIISHHSANSGNILVAASPASATVGTEIISLRIITSLVPRPSLQEKKRKKKKKRSGRTEKKNLNILF